MPGNEGFDDCCFASSSVQCRVVIATMMTSMESCEGDAAFGKKGWCACELHTFAEGKLTLAVAEITPGDREYDRPRVLVQAFENGYRYRVRRGWFECHHSFAGRWSIVEQGHTKNVSIVSTYVAS